MKEFIAKLIELLEDNIEITWKHDYSGGRKDAFNKAIDIVKRLEKEYNNGWIPCNERLPEKSGEYLTYVDYADETFIAIDEIDCDGIIKEWNCTPNYHVIAWQPLPKPYKETT